MADYELYLNRGQSPKALVEDENISRLKLDISFYELKNNESLNKYITRFVENCIELVARTKVSEEKLLNSIGLLSQI